jgi:hypothetical protein
MGPCGELLQAAWNPANTLMVRGFGYANRQTVDPPVVRTAVWWFGIPLVIGAACWTIGAGWEVVSSVASALAMQETECTILEQRLEIQPGKQTAVRIRGGPFLKRTHSLYHPEFRIEYRVDGRRFEMWTYDADDDWIDGAAKDHLMAWYRPGDKRPCFYQRGDPSNAVLTREISLSKLVAALVPLGGLAIAAALWWLAWPLMFQRPPKRDFTSATLAAVAAPPESVPPTWTLPPNGETSSSDHN